MALRILEFSIQLALKVFQFLGANASFSAFQLLFPDGGFAVCLLDKTLEVSTTTLFLLELLAKLIEVGLEVTVLALQLGPAATLFLKGSFVFLGALGKRLPCFGQLVQLAFGLLQLGQQVGILG